jgi:hypothetical protein
MSGGSRGVEERTAADFALLYPPYEWIPACLGVKEQVQQDAAGVWGVPRFFLLSPQEWGIKGVEMRHEESGGGFHFALSAL